MKSLLFLRQRGLSSIVPATVFLIIFLIVPLFLLVQISVSPVDAYNNPIAGFTLDHYGRVFSDPFLAESIKNSLILSVICSVTCAGLAYPVSWYLAKTNSGVTRAIVYMIVLSPLLTSVVVRSYGWRIVLSGQGPVNGVLQALGITDAPLNLLLSPVSTVLVVVHVLLPFAIIVLATSLGAIDKSLYRASSSLGASAVRTFFTVTLPLSIPGLLSGAMIVFSLTMGIYITPLLVGGANQSLAGLRVYNEAMTVFNQPLAAALSFALLVLALIAMAVFGSMARSWEKRING